MTITNKIKSVGSLNSINQAIRLLTNLGSVVIGVNDLTISTLDGDFEFQELPNGRIILK